jgi:hypothetical protein
MLPAFASSMASLDIPANFVSYHITELMIVVFAGFTF